MSRLRRYSRISMMRATSEKVRRKGDGVKRNFGVRNWRRSVGRLNRELEGSEDSRARMEKKVQVRPRLTRSRLTAHPGSPLPFVSFSPSSTFPPPFSLPSSSLRAAVSFHIRAREEYARGKRRVRALPTNVKTRVHSCTDAGI